MGFLCATVVVVVADVARTRSSSFRLCPTAAAGSVLLGTRWSARWSAPFGCHRRGSPF